MASYLWDSQAAKKIEDQELNKFYDENKKHYRDLASDAWVKLGQINPAPDYLKHDDLYDVLRPVLSRDAVTLKGFADKGLPQQSARGWAQWHAWFTHYVADRFLEQQGGKG